MPRFFFDVHDGASVLDEEGTELPDVYAAQAAAIRTAGEILRDLGPRFWDGVEWRMEVFDARRRSLFVLRVSAKERLAPAEDRADPPGG